MRSAGGSLGGACPTPASIAMLSARRDLRAALNRGAAISTLICVGLGVLNLFPLRDIFPVRPIAAILMVFLGLSAWAVRRSISHASDMGPVRAIAAASVALSVVYPALGPTRDSAQYSPLTHLLVMGAICSSVAFGSWFGAFASLLAGYSTFVVRTEQTSLYQGACEGALFFVTGLAGAIAVILVRRANDKVATATSDLWQLQGLADQVRQRELEHARFDAIVHDAVLASLLVAGRGQDPEAARRLAAEAVREYDAADSSPAATGRAWASGIRQAARQLGLELDLRVKGVPGDTWLTSALYTATAEALANVARHSGQRQASVTAVFTPRLLRVLIRDHGRGFDPSAVTTGRAGLAMSINARMHAVGGSVEIDSEPGKGTLVTLTGRPPTTSVTVPPSRWSRRAFVPMVILAMVAIGIHSAIGMTYLTGKVDLPWVTGLAPVALLGILAWTWWAPFRPRRWVSSSVLVVALAALLSINVVQPGANDWRLWYIGAMDGIVGVIAFRYSGRGAVLTALAVPTVVALIFLLRTGHLVVTPVMNSSTQLLVCALLGVVLRRGLTQAAQTLNRVGAATHRLRVDEVARVARSEEIRVRASELNEACLPTLRRIAAGEQLTTAERDLCLLMEAAIRDQLVARPLLSPDLRVALDEARARSVRVDLAIAKTASSVETVRLREVLLVMLPAVPECGSVRATWRPARPGTGSPRRALATIVVAGQETDVVRLATLAGTLTSTPDLAVDHDADVLIVDVLDDEAEAPSKPLAEKGIAANAVSEPQSSWQLVHPGDPCPSF